MVHTKTSHHDRMEVFLEKYREPLPKPLEELERKALSEDVPIIRSGTRDMLRFLLRERKPKEVLEIGTAVGFSALCMREYLPKSSHITTIEKYEKRIPIAKQNFKTAGREDKITLLEGDAGEILAGLSGSFDFIFMDAAKGQYINWLPDILRLLRDGGLLMSDNVLQDGTIMESRYAVERRDRTIHERMREYLYTLKHMEELETSIIPIGDGAAISVKIEIEKERVGK